VVRLCVRFFLWSLRLFLRGGAVEAVQFFAAGFTEFFDWVRDLEVGALADLFGSHFGASIGIDDGLDGFAGCLYDFV
jgi:hypothetical protein